MCRVFCPSQNYSGGKISLADKGQVHHIKNVLRLKINDEITVIDDKGREYISVIEMLTPQNATFKVKHIKNIDSTDKLLISVACAIPKKSKMDDIVDKLTQLGVFRIIPLITSRVIVKLDEKKKNLRTVRWQKIALNSAKQSQRNIVPVIDAVKDIEEVLQESKDFDLKLIGALVGERKPLMEVLVKAKAKNILILIGPEGDFTPEELGLAKKAGCVAVSLGDTVLRVETAAICITSFVRLYENH